MKALRIIALIVMLFLIACGQLSERGVSPLASPTLTEIPRLSETPITPTMLPDEPPPTGAIDEFKTDFSNHSVPYSEILSGGPAKDGISALHDPRFISVSEAEAWLKPAEPVILVEVGDDTRAYPIQVLIWHEIANDTVGGEPLVVTFCPLCNTAIAFKRTFNEQVLDFGTTGRLRYSNLIMYDLCWLLGHLPGSSQVFGVKQMEGILVFTLIHYIIWEQHDWQIPSLA